jgi:hypothetical protein
MKFTIILSMLVIISSIASASDLIKTLDGSVASCESETDVVIHRLSGIYRPLTLAKSGKTAKIELEFLRCVETNGVFSFIRDFSFTSRLEKFADLNSMRREIEISRQNVQLLATNELGEIIDRKELSSNKDGTYSVEINIVSLNYDNSPIGKKSFVIAVQSQFNLIDKVSGELIDRGLENLGWFRLVVK